MDKLPTYKESYPLNVPPIGICIGFNGEFIGHVVFYNGRTRVVSW